MSPDEYNRRVSNLQALQKRVIRLENIAEAVRNWKFDRTKEDELLAAFSALDASPAAELLATFDLLTTDASQTSNPACPDPHPDESDVPSRH